MYCGETIPIKESHIRFKVLDYTFLTHPEMTKNAMF